MLTTVKGYYEQGRVVLSEEAPVSGRVEVIVTFLSDEPSSINSGKKRMPGGLKGKVTIPDDFNEPLDDLKDYM